MFDNVCMSEEFVESKTDLDVSVLRSLFDTCFMQVIKEFQAEYSTTKEALGVSWASLDYAKNNLHKAVSIVASSSLKDCEDECLFETQNDFDDARNKTINFFNKFRNDDGSLSVEKYIAKLAFEPREYEISSLHHHGFPDIVILDFFKRAISENLKWDGLCGGNTILLETIINELDLTFDLKKAFVDRKHVNEFEEPEDMYSYICQELNDGRSVESVYSLIETFLEIQCPEMTLDLTDGNAVDVYSDSNVISGNIDTLVKAVMSEKFKMIVEMELDDCECAVFDCFDKHFI
ncbi:hypothetical protein C7A11_26475 [Pseudomonas simiae]|uniref:hypothetical protein n=1 Tax=Pseudomonas simiae TaxID=321846 RepID=UPI000D02518C|nr:hypothetical protein [Pseudomonas simiae]PRW84336.1 hypothetical protein C7A11_26475 [Pseudomonas simiae]